MDINRYVIARLAIALAIATLVSACGGGGGNGPAAVPAGVALASGYTISVFAKAPLTTQRPDSIIQAGSSVFVGYQNAGEVKDGSVPGVTNAVVQYDLSGNVLKTFTVPGHNDGLLVFDSTHLWVMANEDGNPELTIIDLSAGTQNTYQATVNPTAHGGGYDDMQLINGVVYVTASNPSVPGVAPTVVSLTLNPNGTTFDVAPVLAGNAQALDITPSIGGSPNPTYLQMVTLNLTDPDSEGIDPTGRLVVDSQADGKLVFIQNPGPQQVVSVLSLTLFNDKDGPTVPVDDTRFVPAPGPSGAPPYMLFTDDFQTTYRLNGPFVTGNAYSNGQGQVMQLDITTGHLTPVATSVGNAAALQDPHGMLFIAL
jgi:hypothetical protein